MDLLTLANVSAHTGLISGFVTDYLTAVENLGGFEEAAQNEDFIPALRSIRKFFRRLAKGCEKHADTRYSREAWEVYEYISDRIETLEN